MSDGLSIKELDRVLTLIQKPPIYYLADHRCQKVDKEGNEALFGIEIDDKRVAVMHPDLLPRFMARAEEAGFTPVQFKFEREHIVSAHKILDRIIQENVDRIVALLWASCCSE